MRSLRFDSCVFEQKVQSYGRSQLLCRYPSTLSHFITEYHHERNFNISHHDQAIACCKDELQVTSIPRLRRCSTICTGILMSILSIMLPVSMDPVEALGASPASIVLSASVVQQTIGVESTVHTVVWDVKVNSESAILRYQLLRCLPL